MQTPPLSALFDQWQHYQKAYMNTWQTMQGSLPGQQPNNPWGTALDNWWQSVSAQTTPQTQDLYSILVQQGKSFFDMAGNINGSFNDAFNATGNASEWEDIINQSFDGLRDTLASGSSSVPMDFWKNMVGEQFHSSTNAMPDFLNYMKSSGEQILNAPGVGQNREQQQKMQNLVILAGKFQEASGEYMQVQNKISNLSVDMLQKRVGEMFENKEYPESYRAIYDLWVDCYEDVYAEAVMEPEYNTAYGNMVNSMTAFTKAQREMQDDTLETLGIPTRREVDTLLKRFQEERREKHKMRAEIDELKQQVNQLIESQSKTPAKKSTPVAKTTASSKPKKAVTASTTTRRKTSTAAKPKTTKSKSPKSTS